MLADMVILAGAAMVGNRWRTLQWSVRAHTTQLSITVEHLPALARPFPINHARTGSLSRNTYK